MAVKLVVPGNTVFGTSLTLNGDGAATSIAALNTAGTTSLFTASTTNDFITGTLTGDGGVQVSSGKNIVFGNSTTRIASLTSDGALNLPGSSPALAASNTGSLHYNSSTQHWEISENGGAYTQISTGTSTITGSGTTNKVTKWTNTSILGDSSISDTGLAISITQTVATTGSPTGILWTGAAHTTLTASTEVTDGNFNSARTIQLNTGTLVSQRAWRFQGQTIAFVGVSAVGEACTLEVSPPIAGTNATITNLWAAIINGDIRGNHNSADSNGFSIIGYKTRGTLASPTQTISGDSLLTLIGRGYTSSNAYTTTANAAIDMVAAESFTSAAQGTLMAFSTTATGSNSRSERMRINAAGQLLVGTTAATINAGLDVETVVGSTNGKFGATLATYLVSNNPGVGFNYYIAAGATDKFGKGSVSGTNFCATVSLSTTTGKIVWQASNATGNADATATLVTTQTLDRFGQVVMPQIAQTTGSPTLLTLTAAAHTTLTKANFNDALFDFSTTAQFASGGGTVAEVDTFLIKARTYGAATNALTLTEAGTLVIDKAPVTGTNVTITNAYALWVKAGLAKFAATVSALHFVGNSAAPTIAVGAGTELGTTPTAAVTTGTDAGGVITFTSGTAPVAFTANTAVTIGTVTFNTTYGTAPKAVSVVPANANAAALATGVNGIAFYVDRNTISATQFVIKAITSVAATGTFAASTAYDLTYQVIG